MSVLPWSRKLMTSSYSPDNHHGMFRCTSRCVTCQEHILESDSFKSHTTGAHHKIRGHITCTTSNIIYLISCRICGIQYIGETKNSLKKRFYGHRSTVKTQKLDTPVGQHFNLPNHSISDMILQGIEALANRRESVRPQQRKDVDQACPHHSPPWSQHSGRECLISPFS